MLHGIQNCMRAHADISAQWGAILYRMNIGTQAPPWELREVYPYTMCRHSHVGKQIKELEQRPRDKLHHHARAPFSHYVQALKLTLRLTLKCTNCQVRFMSHDCRAAALQHPSHGLVTFGWRNTGGTAKPLSAQEGYSPKNELLV